MILFSNRVVTSEGTKPAYLQVEDGKIIGIFDANENLVADVDYGNHRIIPGVIDTHNHGGFGYYFDEDIENITWSGKATAANASIKKKAGDKAKNFEIVADTSALSAGEHTLTYVVKLSSKECELITVNLNVGGAASGSDVGNESASAGVEEDGCGAAIGVGASIIALASIGGAAIVIKKKKED